MPEEDDFAAQLASLDRNQLAELLNALNDRENQAFAFGDPTSKAPQQYLGAGLPPSLSAMSDMSMIEKFRHGAGRGSVVGQYRHHRRSKKQKKKKREYKAALASESTRQKELLAERRKLVTNQLRTVDMRDKVNQQFKDLDLEGLHKRVTQQGLDNSLLGISQQYEDLTRQGGFATAGTGLAGSSFDAERLADTQAAQQQDQASAVSQAQMQFNQLNQQSDAQRRSLLASVSGSNPGEEARLSGELANVQNQANNYSTQAGWQQQGMATGQQGMNNQSQALGGLLSTYARLYTQNQMPR